MKVFIISLTLILFVYSSETGNHLEFLQQQEQDTTLLEFEFSANCGLAYLTQSKITNDIINEIRKYQLSNLDYKMTVRTKEDYNIDFEIYLRKSSDFSKKILLVTSNATNQEKHSKILNEYPVKFNSNGRLPTEEQLLKRKDFIISLIEKINNRK